MQVQVSGTTEEMTMNQATANDAEQAFDKFMRNPLVRKIGVDRASFVAGFQTCAEQRDELLAAAKLLLAQYDSSGDFTMGGNLTNKPFLMFRAALEKMEGR